MPNYKKIGFYGLALAIWSVLICYYSVYNDTSIAWQLNTITWIIDTAFLSGSLASIFEHNNERKFAAVFYFIRNMCIPTFINIAGGHRNGFIFVTIAATIFIFVMALLYAFDITLFKSKSK